MTTRSFSATCLFLILLLGLGGSLALAQEPPQASYTDAEYNAYRRAVDESDLSAREDAIITFIRENPGSSLVPYAVAAYIQLMEEYRNQGQGEKVFQAGEKLLQLKPDDLNALYMTASAAFQIGRFDKAAEYGEKVYAQKPDAPGLTFILATSYGQLQKEDEYVKYGEMACQQLPAKDCYKIFIDLTRIYAARQNWAKAATYAQKAIQGLEEAPKPPQTSDREWRDFVSREKAVAYSVMGRRAHESRNWDQSVAHYQKAMQIYQNGAIAAEANYYIGMARWQQGLGDPAMEAFARCSVEKSSAVEPITKACRQFLERLYRSTHNGSLAGLDEFIARVTGNSE